MFGDPISNDKCWKTDRFDDACNGIGDGLHGTPKYTDNEKYYFVNGNNLMDGQIIITPVTLSVDQSEYCKYKIQLDSNTILISINGTLGNLAFFSDEKIILGKSACYCRLKTSINKKFVYGLMKSDKFLQYISGEATASTIKNISLKTMRNFHIILPPIELQNQFADFIDQVDKSKFVINNTIKKWKGIVMII